ncbi:hypothetical protein E4U41_000134 [Claviceps citrina]|nr:hypothetical protein E4U41_000134 [Claviceps citrina]
MSSTALPFLYQTRTLQRALGSPNARPLGRRLVHVPRWTRTRKPDNAIPFEWDHDTPPEIAGSVADRESTITNSEAEIFKGIFDEIAQGRMPAAKKKRPATTTGSNTDPWSTSEGQSWSSSSARPAARGGGMARSIVEQARVMEFREKFLLRYPSSLRDAAQVALGLYETEPEAGGDGAASRKMMELDEADQAKWRERARYERLRTEERERVDALMKACDTDVALWQVMEAEVFSLPARLGILQPTSSSRTRAKTSKQTEAAPPPPPPPPPPPSPPPNPTAAAAADEKRVMDVHGPLYPHFLNHGLALLDTAFARPSDYGFEILPRVKSLGLPSYVLGVSSPFYTRLARMHWTRFGDAASALDVLQEMSSAGLYADEAAHELLVTMRDHLHGCAWGAQGAFVMGMMEAPPYDASLTQRLEDMEKYVVQSMRERAELFA